MNSSFLFFESFRNLLMNEFHFLKSDDFEIFGSALFFDENNNFNKAIQKRYSPDIVLEELKNDGEEKQDLDMVINFQPYKHVIKDEENSCYDQLVLLLKKFFLNFEEIRSSRFLIKFDSIYNFSIDLILQDCDEEDEQENSTQNWTYMKKFFQYELFPLNKTENNEVVMRERRFFIAFTLKMKQFLKQNYLYKLIFGYLNSISLIVFNLYLFKNCFTCYDRNSSSRLHNFEFRKCFLFFLHYFVKWYGEKKIIQINRILEEKTKTLMESKTYKSAEERQAQQMIQIYTPVDSKIILRNMSYYSIPYVLRKFEKLFKVVQFSSQKIGRRKKNQRTFFKRERKNEVVYFKLRMFATSDSRLLFSDILRWKGLIISKLIFFLNDFYLDSYNALYGDTNPENEDDLEFIKYILIFPKCFQKKRSFIVFFKMKLNMEIFKKYYEGAACWEFVRERERIRDFFISSWKRFEERRLRKNSSFYKKGLVTKIVEYKCF